MGAGRLLESLLFEVDPHDLLTLSGSVAVLAITAILANLLPARRAANIDPMGSLRAE